MYHRVGEKRRYEDTCLEDESCADLKFDCVESLGRCSETPVSGSPKVAMEHEKRIRREIANSNERRRMQSINAGFASLKSLLPKAEGEKLSKAAILQHTADYVYQLEQEKTRLLSQNCQLKRLLNNHQQKEFDGNQSGGDSPREDRGIAVSQENMGTIVPSISVSPDPALEDLKRELSECRNLLEHERCQRIKYEDCFKNLEGQIYIEQNEAHKEVSHPGRAFVMTANADLKKEAVTPKPVVVTQIPPTTPHMPVLPLQSTDNMGIKEEKMEVDSEPIISVNSKVVPHQPITLYANSSSTKRHDKLNTAVIPPTGTIVTVVSSKPTTNMPAVLEVHRASDLDVSSSPAEDVNMEDNSTVYIMNTGNSACQKSLDTICEAIRHLEGEHMFPMEDQQSRLEEEVVTDETYTVEEEFQHQSVPQDHHPNPTEIVKFTECPATVVCHPLYSSHAPISHPLGGSMSNLTLQMMPNEPQEVPLELTTTHRGTEYHSLEGRPMTSQSVLSHSSSSRPGVIVVKQT